MIKKSLVYLGAELKKFREETMHLSQVEFGRVFDISKSLVCKVEAGERRYSEEIMSHFFSEYSIDRYMQLKFLILSELPFELINTEEDCYNVIKLVVELKNKGLYSIAKELIQKSLNTFDDSVDFYVLLSTVNLMENKYKESEENIILALDLYKSGIKSITTEADIYHNYGNIFFNQSYNSELNKMKFVTNLVKKNLNKNDILNNKEYIKISNDIMDLYIKAEEQFLKAYSINNKELRVISQLARLYFNIFNLNPNKLEYIDKSYLFLNKYIESEKANINRRVELTILLSIIMSFKNMSESSIILLHTLSGFQENNPLIYYAKALVYSSIANNDEIILNKSIDNIRKTLEISNFDEDIKLQILSDLNFDNVKHNILTKEQFKKLLF